MKYPLTPAPDSIKPVLQQVKETLTARLRTKPYFFDTLPNYLCHIIAIIDDEHAEAARDFIQESLGEFASMGGWLWENDPDYKQVPFAQPKDVYYTRYQDSARLEWLTYLTEGSP